MLLKDARHNPFNFDKETKEAPSWVQELIENHESLPWQRRGYLRDALLDQLTTAAGFAPLPSSAEGQGAGEVDEQVDSVREFLDTVRSGWGARFGAVFESIGIETKSDLRMATGEEMAELDEKLGATGAGSFQLRQILWRAWTVPWGRGFGPKPDSHF